MITIKSNTQTNRYKMEKTTKWRHNNKLINKTNYMTNFMKNLTNNT